VPGPGHQDGRGDGHLGRPPSASAGLHRTPERRSAATAPRFLWRGGASSGATRGPAIGDRQALPETSRAAHGYLKIFERRSSSPTHRNERRNGARPPQDAADSGMTRGRKIEGTPRRVHDRRQAAAKGRRPTGHRARQSSQTTSCCRHGLREVLRCPSHDRIRSIDVSKAAALPGVIGNLVAAELPYLSGNPAGEPTSTPGLEKVASSGDPWRLWRLRDGRRPRRPVSDPGGLRAARAHVDRRGDSRARARITTTRSQRQHPQGGLLRFRRRREGFPRNDHVREEPRYLRERKQYLRMEQTPRWLARPGRGQAHPVARRRPRTMCTGSGQGL